MPTRLGTSGLAAPLLVAVLVLSTACASSGAEHQPAQASGASPTTSTASQSTGATGASAVPAVATAKTKISGCNSAGHLEVCFSSPSTHGGSDPAVVRHFIDIFNSASAGDSLRIAMFRWDIPATTTAIVAAQKRGAHVEIVADEDMTTKPAGREVIAKIEAGDPMPGNVVVCKGACLPWAGAGPKAPPSQDVNHLKFLLADIGGKKSVITSSSNFEGRQYSQVNSLTRVYDDAYYGFGLGYFQRLRAQSWTVGGDTWTAAKKKFKGVVTAQVYPSRSDLVVNTLKQVHCAPGMDTVNIMVAVIQRYDVRAQIGRLWSEGCTMHIVTTRDLIENWIQRPFVAANGKTVDIADDNVRTIVAHDKVYAIHAKIQGKERYVVLTGTSNTTCGGLLYNDEMMVKVEGKWAFSTYDTHVLDAFKHAHQSRESAQPVQAHCH